MCKRIVVHLDVLVLIALEILFGFLFFWGEDPVRLITIFVIQYLFILYITKFDFENPLCWYLGVFTLYTIGYPLLFITGNDISQKFSPEPIRWCWIAVFVFIVVFNLTKEFETRLEDRIWEWNNNYIFKWFILGSGLYVLSAAYLISAYGYRHKTQIYADGNLYITVAFSVVYLIHTIYIFLMEMNVYQKKEKDNPWLMIFVGLVSLFISMYSGERDIILRFMVITAFYLYFHHKISKVKMVIFVCFFLSLLVLSASFKEYFLTGESGNIHLDFDSKIMINTLFRGEFKSASKNLQILANDSENAFGIMGGLSYFSDITRVFGYAPNSSLSWFNNTYYSGSSVGHGFTIVGEGIVNFGIIGIVFNFAIIGLMIGYLYAKRYRNPIYSCIYIVSVPIFMYAIRADFANIVSPLLRHILFPLVLLGMLSNNLISK